MTKKELFEILENCPDDAEVYIETFFGEDDSDENCWGTNLRDPFPSVQMVKDFKIATRPCKETNGAKKSIVL